MAISDKLTYLNETKSQLKDMINYGLDTDEKITSETTFRNYVKSLFDAFIKTMTYPDVLYNNLPKVTGEGTSLTLNNTVYAPMIVELSPSALEQETSILPSEYTQVDYIESTGTQYIDTGVKPSPDTKIDIDFAYLDSTYNGYVALFGERGATSDTYFGLYINKTDGKLAINYSKYDGGTSSTTTISRNVKYNIKNDYGSFYLNNASTPFQNTTQTLTTSTTSVYLLEQHLYNGSVQSRGMQAKIYQCKFYEGSTLTRNFIPCYRNSDNEIGMYDLVNEVFYTNAGTGTFVKGNNSVLPNPDFPQEIHTVSGENTIKIKNSDNTQEQTYPISLGDLEYCKIGDYEDEFYKATESDTGLTAGKWYLKKNVGKLIIDENTGLTTATTDSFKIPSYISDTFNRPPNTSTPLSCYSNYLRPIRWNASWNNITGFIATNTNGATRIRINENMTLAEVNQWLSTHNIILYVQLKTPTYTLLSDTLQTQLDNIQKAISYQDQTNVSQTNNDLPFVIKMSAIRDLSGIFELIQG